MKKSLSIFITVLFILVVFLSAFTVNGCTPASPGISVTGTLVLKLTDAPVDDPNIAGVYIKIFRIEVNKDDNWITATNWALDPRVINLNELTGGISMLLGEIKLPAGQYNQIRFIIDIKEQDVNPPSNSGCYVDFKDEKANVPLFAPSGGKNGYKVIGNFTIPVGGEVAVTVDWDLQQSLVVTGQGENQKYILKPTLLLLPW